jgi:predicted TIM-barrel fold metal-dependent hydrolase
MIPLLIHTDPAVIDSLYSISPGQPVIWAHAGKYPYTDLIADYLERYPALYIDLSMRDERIAPGGQITDDWYELIVTYPDRFMIGVDTYSTARWHEFSDATTKIRHWISQLPPDVAGMLTFKNADRVYRYR